MATLNPSQGKAVVKCVLDNPGTVVLRGAPGTALHNSSELVFTLNGIDVPKNTSGPYAKASERVESGKAVESDEHGLWIGFMAREFVRRLLVGRDVAYTSTNSTSNTRCYGALTLRYAFEGESSVSRILVKHGWAKPNQHCSEDLKELEREAKEHSRGLWASSGIRSINAALRNNVPTELLRLNKTRRIPAVMEQVLDGSTYRVLLCLSDDNNILDHLYITLCLSGIKAPASDSQSPFSEEAKLFVEQRLLQRDIHVILESISGTAFVGSVLFPAGSIAEALLNQGLARTIDWNLSVVSGDNVAASYQQAQQRAKAKKLRIWLNDTSTSTDTSSEFEATVIRIVGPDILVVLKGDSQHKIQLASVRGPKRLKNDSGFDIGFNLTAQEFLRSKLIGKRVSVKVDYIKPSDDTHEQLQCATVSLLPSKQNIGELLVSRGFATVMRHRKDDHNRASCYDALLLAEDKAIKANKGLHDPAAQKEPPVHRVIDISESAAKAKQHLSYLQRAKQLAGIVEFISSGSRFKIHVPSQSAKLTLVLGGIRAPRTARANNPSEKHEPYGPEALAFMTKLAMQRDVELTIDSMDKVGGFIGNLFIVSNNERINAAVALLENGLAQVHDYSVSQNPFMNAYYEAEAKAKDQKKNIWLNYDPDASNGDAELSKLEQQFQQSASVSSAPSKANNSKQPVFGVAQDSLNLVPVFVSEISPEGQLYVQRVGDELTKLETLMSSFAAHHQSTKASSDAPVKHKQGDFCSARFTLDNSWYRARIKKVSNGGTQIHVQYVDYGNEEVVPLSHIRPLPPQFNTSVLKPQAVEVRLAFVEFPFAEENDVALDALQELKSATENKQVYAHLVVGGYTKNSSGANVPQVLLFDSVAGARSTSPSRAKKADRNVSLNEYLISEGLVYISKLDMKRFNSQHVSTLQSGVKTAWSTNGSANSKSAVKPEDTVLGHLVDAQERAKQNRLSLWQYGDIAGDDEL